MIAIPEDFVRETVGREGESGQRWIAALPALVDELLHRWSCVPDGPVLHGRVGLVVPVRRAGLPPAVLKVSFPHPGNVFEPHAFAAWAGRGAVRLFERARRWAQVRAVESTLWGRRHGDEAWLIDVTDRLAAALG
ncbi:aminoglycoside phosphotransferase family protein [Nocardia cyriacigeorgica]|uniref:aminoglycoside phosphotransferase family protein n=1 Tax=Nocardia cyriacigeorgica TaxID=135487 RepID=UPI0018952B27|nr:aminoglycoside phosphotransferase family protein [Nocardia cyriacigeorgica]MBF6455179.1 hypothetical protein [Nocardia cyriacigeorgica]MBF6478229.1 hypothetical protein [Nocardia cyriacigeorgica]MBF6554079.1 hypothetical protein [Nocardia cyriacigeorgica]